MINKSYYHLTESPPYSAIDFRFRGVSMLYCETGMKKTAVRVLCTAAVLLLLFGVFSGATVAASSDKQPHITITEAPEVLAQGEILVVRGTADGMPQYVLYYIFGTNYFRSDVASVADGEFTIEVDNATFIKAEDKAFNKDF